MGLVFLMLLNRIRNTGLFTHILWLQKGHVTQKQGLSFPLIGFTTGIEMANPVSAIVSHALDACKFSRSYNYSVQIDKFVSCPLLLKLRVKITIESLKNI